MTKGGTRLVYVWAHCDGHIFAKYIEINCLDQRNLTSFQLTSLSIHNDCLQRSPPPVSWQSLCCPFSGASAPARTRNVLSQKGSNSWNGKWPFRWSDLPNYENFQTQRKPGAKSCLESSASVIPFVRWNRYHRQMYSTSWIDARYNSDQEEPSVHKNPLLHILQDGGFIWILTENGAKVRACAGRDTAPSKKVKYATIDASWRSWQYGTLWTSPHAASDLKVLWHVQHKWFRFRVVAEKKRRIRNFTIFWNGILGKLTTWKTLCWKVQHSLSVNTLVAIIVLHPWRTYRV